MATLKQQTSLFTGDLLTSSPADSLASHTVQPESEKEKKMTATSGRRCLEQLSKFSHVGSLAKTFLACLIGTGEWYSMRSRLTWKLRGLKSSHHLYCQLVPSMLHTEGIGFGLLPTNQARDWKGAQGQAYLGKAFDLPSVVMGMLPTPATRDWKGARSTEALEKSGRTEKNSLPDTFHQTGKSSQLNPQFVMEMMGFPPDWTLLPFLNGEVNQSKQEETQ